MAKPDTGNMVLLAFDVDGVMTDGRIVIDQAGNDERAFDVQDGMGVTLWHEAGGKTALISSRESQAVARRAAELRIGTVLQGRRDKLEAFKQLLAELDLAPAQSCFIGDDLLDLSVMRHCGYAVAVANAVDEVKAVADYVTGRSGGRGAIREAVEHLLKRDQKWAAVLAGYDERTG